MIETVRASLLGCLLAGGMLFGAAGSNPRGRLATRDAVFGEARVRVPLRDGVRAAWFQPPSPYDSVLLLWAQAGELPTPLPSTLRTRARASRHQWQRPHGKRP